LVSTIVMETWVVISLLVTICSSVLIARGRGPFSVDKLARLRVRGQGILTKTQAAVGRHASSDCKRHGNKELHGSCVSGQTADDDLL
jgi:hypothetical protein